MVIYSCCVPAAFFHQAPGTLKMWAGASGLFGACVCGEFGKKNAQYGQKQKQVVSLVQPTVRPHVGSKKEGWF